jgi:hypothetical protein
MPGFLCAALIEDISSSVSFTSYCVVSRPEPQRSGAGTGYQEIGTHAFGILCFGDDGRPALHGPRKRDLCWRRARACRCLNQRFVLENWREALAWTRLPCSCIPSALQVQAFMDLVLPNGEYATSRMPAASHIALSSCHGRLGCACIWFAAGTTFALLSRRWSSGGPKFEIPIARTLPVRSPGQQRAHVQVVIIDPSRATPPLPPMSLRSSGSRDHERPARHRQSRLGSDRRLLGPACTPVASASNHTSSVYT